MNNNLVIDGHSHCGLDIFHGDTNIDNYIEFAKNSGINVGLIMNVPSPCKDINDPNSRYMYWTYDNKRIYYHGIENPYLELNYYLYWLLQHKKNDFVKLIFVPTIHPALDNPKDLEKLINITDPVAIKIHGIGSGVGPKDFNDKIISIIKHYNLPLIIHSDRDNGASVDESMFYIRNINNARDWAEFLIKNEIIGTINHGASLDIDTFDLANRYDFVKIALGPDLVACIDSNRLKINCNGDYRTYLQLLKNYLDINKIIYDADYNWNTLSGEDFSSVERVKEMFNEEEQKKVFFENIIRHYPKLIRKIGGVK